MYTIEHYSAIKIRKFDVCYSMNEPDDIILVKLAGEKEKHCMISFI